MKKKIWILPLLFLLLMNSCTTRIKSPDGNITVYIKIMDVDKEEDCLVYRVGYKGKNIIVNSRLGFELSDNASVKNGFKLSKVTRNKSDTIWQPVYGEQNRIRDFYNQLTLNVKQKNSPLQQLNITVRAYNEGIAFCYSFPEQETQKNIKISTELSEFRFAENHKVWAAYFAQDEYYEVPLSEIKPGCERPLTIEIDTNLYVALAEAGLVDYPRMKFTPIEGDTTGLVSSLSSEVSVELPFVTPWRVILIGESPGQLLENNFIFLNLNEICAIEDPSWIKPGKVIREVTLTTKGGKACIDFAEKHNLQYVEYDAGWYGREHSVESNATTVTVDPKRSPGPLDLQEVIQYANQKNIGIILYVNHLALENQLDEILPLYKQWGVKGLKYGFVNVGSQTWTTWLHEAIRKASDNQLMVDVHDEYRPTGFSRTYPNFMTQEGIRGDEARPSNSTTLSILFTRMLAGAGDNTICYFDKRVDELASHAYQLAKAVCIYSPWQFLYWYDRPKGSPQNIGGAGGKHPVIEEVPELEFFDYVPTVWDETKVLYGKIGEYAVIARRSGEDWFIGCMNGNKPWTFEIPFKFLKEGKKYVAHVYSDNKTVKTLTHVRIDRYIVDSGTVFIGEIASRGGLALRIVPANEDDFYPQY